MPGLTPEGMVRLQPVGMLPLLSTVHPPVRVVLPIVPNSVSPAANPEPVAVNVDPAAPEEGEMVRMAEPTINVAVPEWP